MAGHAVETKKSYDQVQKDRVAAYIWQNSLREPAFLQKIREETEKSLEKAFMLVDPVESQFLRFLVNASGAKR